MPRPPLALVSPHVGEIPLAVIAPEEHRIFAPRIGDDLYRERIENVPVFVTPHAREYVAGNTLGDGACRSPRGGNTIHAAMRDVQPSLSLPA